MAEQEYPCTLLASCPHRLRLVCLALDISHCEESQQMFSAACVAYLHIVITLVEEPELPSLCTGKTSETNVGTDSSNRS